MLVLNPCKFVFDKLRRNHTKGNPIATIPQGNQNSLKLFRFASFGNMQKDDSLTLRLKLEQTKGLSLATLATDTTVSMTTLHEQCYDQKNPTLAFRASWVLEQVAYQDPERFLSIFEAFASRTAEQTNPSCQRHFTKIWMYLTAPRIPVPYQEAYRNVNRAALAETIFSWLIRPKTPVAVQVNCLDILYNLIGEYDWIKDELTHYIEFLMRDGSAALQSRGKKILQKIRRLKP